MHGWWPSHTYAGQPLLLLYLDPQTFERRAPDCQARTTVVHIEPGSELPHLRIRQTSDGSRATIAHELAPWYHRETLREGLSLCRKDVEELGCTTPSSSAAASLDWR